MSFDIHRAALDRYGLPAQILQTCEECAEPQQALLHYLRCRQSDVVGEIADVLVMANQMRLAFGPEEVDQAVQMKLDRLKGRING